MFKWLKRAVSVLIIPILTFALGLTLLVSAPEFANATNIGTRSGNNTDGCSVSWTAATRYNDPSLSKALDGSTANPVNAGYVSEVSPYFKDPGLFELQHFRGGKDANGKDVIIWRLPIASTYAISGVQLTFTADKSLGFVSGPEVNSFDYVQRLANNGDPTLLNQFPNAFELTTEPTAIPARSRAAGSLVWRQTLNAPFSDSTIYAAEATLTGTYAYGAGCTRTATVTVTPKVTCGPANDTQSIVASIPEAIEIHRYNYGGAEAPANERFDTVVVKSGYQVVYQGHTYVGGTADDTFNVTQVDRNTPCASKTETVKLQQDLGLRRMNAAQAALWNKIMKDGQWSYREDVRMSNDKTKTGRVLSAPLWGYFRSTTVSVKIPLASNGKPLVGAARQSAIASAVGQASKPGVYRSARAGQVISAWFEVQSNDWGQPGKNTVKNGAQSGVAYRVR